MLVSAVPDPSAFDISYFDDSYRAEAEAFLNGIEKNGVLIVDRGKRILPVIIKDMRSDPNRYGKRLVTKFEEILKKKKRRIVMFDVSQDSVSLKDLLELACHMKTVVDTDALIVSDDSLQKLKSQQKYDASIIPLSDYRNSDFEKNRQRYETQGGPIDKFSKSEIEDIIIRSVRFTKWLRFYDAYIGSGENTSRFREGIKYILSIWHKHGYFTTEQGIGSVEIFTRSANQIRDGETNHARKGKLERNQENHRKIVRELIEPLNSDEDFSWQIKLSVKDDPDGIFHARYLETQQAIIRIDKGFDLFKQDGAFRRNFLTLNMTEGSHLRECRELMDWNP